MGSAAAFKFRRLAVVTERLLIRDALVAVCAADGWTPVESNPDVVMVDAAQGMGAVRYWHGRGVSVVVIGHPGGKPSIPDFLLAGAHSVVLETSPSSDLLRALHYAAGGVRISAADSDSAGEWRADALAGLSPRERQVFHGLVEGKRSKEVAFELGLSPKTVDSYRASMMAKLGIHEVAGLVRYGVRHKLINDV